MNPDTSDKAFFIKAYFDDLQRRIAFLPELLAMARTDEALMLCCCYIEALGSRESSEPERKAKNYCTILANQGHNEIWHLIHPKQLKNVLSRNGLFCGAIGTLAPLLDRFGSQLIDPKDIRASLDPTLNEQQRIWLEDNIFKGSVASISYERIRCELVHDISGGRITFSETTYEGCPVPDLDFEILFASLQRIVDASQTRAVSTNTWWFER